MAKQESKSDRFVRIAEARTNKIINMIQLLGNCSNKGTYDYTKEDVRKIFANAYAAKDRRSMELNFEE